MITKPRVWMGNNRPMENIEVEEAIKFSSPNKAPGPNGFNAHFYKICWPIIGKDVIKAIKDFFHNGNLLQQVKHTFIALMPKKGSPLISIDYRPISLTNEI